MDISVIIVFSILIIIIAAPVAMLFISYKKFMDVNKKYRNQMNEIKNVVKTNKSKTKKEKQTRIGNPKTEPINSIKVESEKRFNKKSPTKTKITKQIDPRINGSKNLLKSKKTVNKPAVKRGVPVSLRMTDTNRTDPITKTKPNKKTKSGWKVGKIKTEKRTEHKKSAWRERTKRVVSESVLRPNQRLKTKKSTRA